MTKAWMPFYGGDFFGNTLHLSAAEIGAYICLIWHYWEHGGLPLEDSQIARIARANARHWPRIRNALAPMFGYPVQGTKWTHSRVDLELLKKAKISNVRKASALQMHSKKSANALQMHTQSQSIRKKDAASAAIPLDQEADLFRRGKEVLGEKAGGLIAKLKAHE